MKNKLILILLLFPFCVLSQDFSVCGLHMKTQDDLIVFLKDFAQVEINVSEGDSTTVVLSNLKTKIYLGYDKEKYLLRSLSVYSNDKKFVKTFSKGAKKAYKLSENQYVLKCEDDLTLIYTDPSDKSEYKWHYQVLYTYESETEYHDE